MTLAEFWDELNRHDWTFCMSDDHSVWRRGRDNRERLVDITKEGGPEYVDLYNQFSQHFFCGTDKPTRPEK